MGFRTIVMLNNDQANEWQNDTELGNKIARGMNHTHETKYSDHDFANLRYGRVVECTHADTETLAVLTHYEGFRPIAHSGWRGSENSQDDIAVKLLKDAAEALGYRLVKKPVKAK